MMAGAKTDKSFPGSAKLKFLFRRTLKRGIAMLSPRVQLEMRRWQHRIQRVRGRFDPAEPEFAEMSGWLESGDCALDVGANVGHYTLRLSELVGEEGRVIALEPIPEAFELLTANAARRGNVTLLNVAASDRCAFHGMHVPSTDTGLKNYYLASLSREVGDTTVLVLPIDHLNLDRPVKLAKIDAEGHELEVLKGMSSLLSRDHPILIVEGNAEAVEDYLLGFGYKYCRLEGSPNRIYRHQR